MTLGEIIHAYMNDPDSSFHGLRYHVRQNNIGILRRIDARHGNTALADIKIRQIKSWHKDWADNGRKPAIGHDMIKHLRTIIRFGATYVEDPECVRLAVVLSSERFPNPKGTPQQLTTAQVVAIRARAHEREWHSIGLGQSFQYECTFRQKDVIGERVPLSEPGPETYCYGHLKWLRGITWEEIDTDLVLNHITSKKNKAVRINLRLAPMVMEELALIARCDVSELTRDKLPATGPMVICEWSGYVWSNYEYRRKWRIIADEVGVPKAVKNRHSRHGGLREGMDAGADIENLKELATHSDVAMTAHYVRENDNSAKIEAVQLARIAHRERLAGNDNQKPAANDNLEELKALLRAMLARNA